MVMNLSSLLVLTAAACLAAGGSDAFVQQKSGTTAATGRRRLHDVGNNSNSRLYENTKTAPAMPPIKDISYGEESRKYRRTVYTHDDWRKHRSPDRFIYYLQSLFVSGVYKNIGREVAFTTSVAALVCLYNGLITGFTDFNGVQQDALLTSGVLPLLGLPLTPFTLSSPSLGLLLVFRTNTSYQRWDEARKNWGMNINHTRDLVRMGNAMYDRTAASAEQAADDLKVLALCTWAFVRAMKRHLSPEDEDEEDFRQELLEKLPQEQAERILAAAHRPNRALQDLSLAIENLPMHFMRKNEIHKAATIFEDNLGSSERLLTSPVPLFYSRHTARFLTAWLLLLPLALYDPFKSSWNHIAMIPATAGISVFLFGIEELATQLEEPFTILPMQAFCDKIYNWCNEIVSFEPGDNGMKVNTPRKEHTVAFLGETSGGIFARRSSSSSSSSSSNKKKPAAVAAKEIPRGEKVHVPASIPAPTVPVTASVAKKKKDPYSTPVYSNSSGSKKGSKRRALARFFKGD